MPFLHTTHRRDLLRSTAPCPPPPHPLPRRVLTLTSVEGMWTTPVLRRFSRSFLRSRCCLPLLTWPGLRHRDHISVRQPDRGSPVSSITGQVTQAIRRYANYQSASARQGANSGAKMSDIHFGPTLNHADISETRS